MPKYLNLALTALLLLAVAACGGKETSFEDAASDLKASAENLAATIKDLDPDTVKKVGQIAAKLEDAPAAAMKLIEDNGWTKEHFDKIVAHIKDNKELTKIFEAAKSAASGH